jgi:hypothetical protein
MRASLTLPALVALAFTIWPVACGPSGNNQGFGDDASMGDDNTKGDDGAANDGIISFGDSGDVVSCPGHCSADLHSVLDCNNKVILTCPGDQGCGPNGQCVAACDSATANKSTIGCDYYSVDPGTDGEANGSCFAAYIANTWGSDATIKIDYNGQTVDATPYSFIPQGSGMSLTYMPLPSGKLPKGQLAIVFLADATAVIPTDTVPTKCPAGTKAFYTTAEASSEQTAIIHSFHITTSVPVVAYDIFPYGGSLSYITSATLLLPSSAWDTNYIAIDAIHQDMIAMQDAPNQQPFIEIAAASDGTHVTISPTAAIVGGNGVMPTAQGKPITYTLNHGEVVQLKQNEELNGSPIQSDKPIGVWGGHSCMRIPDGQCCCDSGHQELPPVKALGNEYVAVRYKNRGAMEETPPWRILGAVDGTTLTYDPATPTGAPTTINSGQVVQFDAAGPFVVKSQDAKHPFYVSGHMTDGTDPNTGSIGDPEFVNLVPPQQYLSDYVFMTDPTIGNTNLVLVRTKDMNGVFQDVKLDCSGTVTGWQPVGAGKYQYARVDIAIMGAGVGACNNGRHEITSMGSFGLTVWGWDQYVSYAYPSGASVQPINDVVVPPTPK